MSDATRGLLNTTDAMIWAEEFCRIFDSYVICHDIADEGGLSAELGGPYLDAGTIVSWFANAMQTALDHGERFMTYEMADGSMIFDEYQWVTDLEFFDERDEEIKLVKKTYRLISSEEVVLPDPYPIEEEDEDDDVKDGETAG